MVATTANITVRAKWEGQSVSKGVKTVETDMTRLKSTMQRMAPILRGIGAMMSVAAGVQVARQVIGIADAWKGYDNRIRLFTNSAKELKATQLELFAISQRTRVSMGSTVDLYARLSVANKALGLDSAALHGVLETISQTLIISGGSADSANAAVIQLGQGLASGVLRGEELNSVMEQAPRLAFALAAGMNVPIGKLRELGAAGKITSTQVIQALQSQSAAVGSEFAKIVPTVETAWQKMTDAVGKYISEFDESVQMTERLAKAMSDIADAVGAADGSASSLQASREVSNEMARVAPGSENILPPGVQWLAARITGDLLSMLKPLSDRLEGDPGVAMLSSMAPAASQSLEPLHDATLLPEIGLKAFPRDKFIDRASFGRSELEEAWSFQRGGDTKGSAFRRGLNENRRGVGMGEGLSGGSGVQLGGMGAGIGMMLDTTLGGGGGTRQQLQLQQREAEALATSERELLEVRQKFESANARLADQSDAGLKMLAKVHVAELVRFDDNAKLDQQKKDQKENDRRWKEVDRALNKQAREDQEKLNDLYKATSSMIRQVNPLLADLGTSLLNIATGGSKTEFALDGLSLAVGVFAQEAAKAAASLQRAQNAIKTGDAKSRPVASSIVKSQQPEVFAASLERVNEQVTGWFDSLRGLGHTVAETVERMFGSVELLTAANKDFAHRHFSEIMADLGATPDQLESDLGNLGMTLSDAIGSVLTVEDAFRDLGAAAADLASPLERATVATFDIKEQAIRRQAQGAFNLAGSDVLAQAQAYKALKASIDALAQSEAASLKALDGVNVAGVAATTDSGGTVGDPEPVVLDASALVDAGAVIPIQLPWSSAVEMVVDVNQLHEPEAWWALVNIPTDLERYERSWYEVLTMRPWAEHSERRAEPEAWWALVNIPTGLRRYERSWHEVLTMRPWAEHSERRAEPEAWWALVNIPTGLRRYERSWHEVLTMRPWAEHSERREKPEAWWALVDIPTDGLQRYERSWHEVLTMRPGGEEGAENLKSPDHWSWLVDIPADLTRYARSWYEVLEMRDPEEGTQYRATPGHFSWMVDVPTGTPRIDKSWSEAVSISKGNEDALWGMTHWNQALTLSGATPYNRTFTDAVSIGPAQMGPGGEGGRHQLDSWSDVLDVSQADRIVVSYSDIITFSDSPRKISITDIVDLSELEGIVSSVVARDSANRTGGDNKQLTRTS